MFKLFGVTVAAATAATAASESQPPATFRPRPREPDTTMGIKRRLQTRTRPPSAQEEAEYTEIVYELQTDETSSTRGLFSSFFISVCEHASTQTLQCADACTDTPMHDFFCLCKLTCCRHPKPCEK